MTLRVYALLIAVAVLAACRSADHTECRESCVDSFDLCISMAPGGAAVESCLAKQRACERDCG